MKKKKILYICPVGYKGGAERFLLQAALAHKKRGQFHPVLLFLNSGEAHQQSVECGIETYLLPFPLRLSKPLSLLKTILWTRKLIINHQISLLHHTMSYGQIIGGLSSLGLKIPKVWFQHGPVGGILNLLAQFFPCQLLIFNSKYLKSAHEKLPFSSLISKKDIVLKLGIEESSNLNALAKGQVRKKLNISPNHKVILMAGRLSPIKGYELTIQAIGQLKKETNYPDSYWDQVKVYLIGSANNEEERKYERSLHKEIHLQELTSNVELLPFQKNISEWMKASDLFILNTKIPEAFGLVVAEAMIQKTLVIGPNQGGTSEILVNQKTGFTYPSHSGDGHRKLCSILKNILSVEINTTLSQKIETIKDQAYKNIKSSYSIEGMTATLEKEYQILLG